MSSPDTEFIRIMGANSGEAEAPPARIASKALPDVLPVLGLSDIVIFPGIIAPLMVDTPQSIRLVNEVVAGDRFVCLVLQRKPEIDNPKPADLWSVGCAARILKMLKFPDGTVRVLVEGLRRVEIKEYVAQEPFLRARVETIKELPDESVELVALNRNAQRQFQEIINLSPGLSEQVKITAHNTEEPARLADLIASNLNLSLEERQHLLEMRS